MQKISPCLWFDNNAEEAVKFYASIVKNTEIKATSRYGEEGPGPAGGVMTILFKMQGIEFLALNGGPHFQFTPAVSFILYCDTQEEVDEYWEKLSEGGRQDMCGWLQDKFGLSWQITPRILGDLMQDKDNERRGRVMKAMLQMQKLDIEKLKEAYNHPEAVTS